MVTITAEEFRTFADYVRKNYGINFKQEKQTLVAGRLNGVLMSNNFQNLSEYMDYVAADKTGQAVATMLNKITTNHTFFMREPAHFEYFQSVVLPQLSRSVRNKDLRIWSAACSSGEEPYTLAMMIDEYFGREKTLWDAKILATDISTGVLEKAKKGVYAKDAVAALPAAWRNAYFKELDAERCALTDRIKNEVIYGNFNLMERVFPFRKKFHVIFCRNVMIYFDEKTKNELIQKFYDLTESGGYLFIGHSESIKRELTRYKYVMPAVYRKE